MHSRAPARRRFHDIFVISFARHDESCTAVDTFHVAPGFSLLAIISPRRRVFGQPPPRDAGCLFTMKPACRAISTRRESLSLRYMRDGRRRRFTYTPE